jgi:hypothetical protein
MHKRRVHCANRSSKILLFTFIFCLKHETEPNSQYNSQSYSFILLSEHETRQNYSLQSAKYKFASSYATRSMFATNACFVWALWSVIGWIAKYLLCRPHSYYGRHVKPLVTATFSVVSTHQSTLDPRGGLLPVLLISP